MTGDDTTTTSTQTTSVEWRDAHLRIEGPAVAGLQAGFLDNWADQNDDGFDPSDTRLVAEDHVGDTAMSAVRGTTVTLLVPRSHADKRLSANVNQRSTQCDEETNVIIFDPDVVDVLDAHFRDDLRSSRALDPADWADRGLMQRAAEKATEVVSGWL